MIFSALFSLVLVQVPVDPLAVRTDISFARQPDISTLHQTFGAVAPEGGRIEMRCDVRADGGLASCVVRDETPEGRNLGPRALGLVDHYRVSDPDHRMVGKALRFTIYWPAVTAAHTDH